MNHPFNKKTKSGSAKIAGRKGYAKTWASRMVRRRLKRSLAVRGD